MKKLYIFLYLLFLQTIAQGQSFVSIDSLLNPVKIRKHVEIGLFSYYPSIGFGLATFKGKESWAFTGNIGGRAWNTIYLSEKILFSTLQTEYRHRIKNKKQPVFWHIDAGLNYISYRQESSLLTQTVVLDGNKVFPNIGFGTGYYFAITDKHDIEILATANFQLVDKNISNPINSIFIAQSVLMINDGFSAILKLRYGF